MSGPIALPNIGVSSVETAPQFTCANFYPGTASADFADFDAYIAIGSASFYSHIESVSVSMWASSKHCAHYNIHKIRDFLSPQDSVVKTIMS